MNTQEIIRRYTKSSGYGGSYATLASSLGSLTWDRPLYSDYQLLLRYLLLRLQTVIPLLELRLLCSLGGLGVFWYSYLFDLFEDSQFIWPQGK